MDLGGNPHQVRDRTFHCQTRRKKVSTIRVGREETVVNDNRDSLVGFFFWVRLFSTTRIRQQEPTILFAE